MKKILSITLLFFVFTMMICSCSKNESTNVDVSKSITTEKINPPSELKTNFKIYGQNVSCKSVYVYFSLDVYEKYDNVDINKTYIDCYINNIIVCTIPNTAIKKILYNY